MGAMQAQDYPMAKWGIGIRLPGSTEKSIEECLNRGEIIRTHLLRPTWHFVTAEDIAWMLELTAPHIKSALKSRHRELEITETLVQKSHAVLRKILSDKSHLEREILMAELSKAKIPTDNSRLSHLLLRAELDALICSGAIRNNKRTYTLLEPFLPKIKKRSREEALAELANRYFSSHGPATLPDFAWWSGLSVADSRLGIEMNKPDLIHETIDTASYWFFPSREPEGFSKKQAFLLPAYDEYIISYRNRMAVLTHENHAKSVSDNGIFRPVIIINGQVTGLWKRTLKNEKLLIEITPFRTYNKSEIKLIDKASGRLAMFYEKKVSVRFM